LEKMGGGSFVDGVYPNFGPGPIHATGQTLDLAINGDGFLTCSDGARNLYTRAGDLARMSDGTLVTSTGLKVLDDAGGTITLPTDAVTIDREGAILGPAGEVAGARDCVALTVEDTGRGLTADAAELPGSPTYPY